MPIADTLYGYPETVPIAESALITPINPHGYTKAAVEQMLCNDAAREAGWRTACLRYFNPVGSHPSGRIGEDPNGIPNKAKTPMASPTICSQSSAS